MQKAHTHLAPSVACARTRGLRLWPATLAAVLSCLLSVSTALAAGPRPAAFRRHAKKEMEVVLGATLRLHQDCVDAAYLAVGWKWGDPSSPQMDAAAYRKSWEWGFRLDEFALTPTQRFRNRDLATAALDRDTETRRIGVAELFQPAQPTLAPPEARDRIADLERRIAQATQLLEDIATDMSLLGKKWLEENNPRTIELKAVVMHVERSIQALESSLESMNEELHGMTERAVAQKGGTELASGSF
jgi:hypothetical protein